MTVELSPPPRRGADLKDYIAYIRYLNAIRITAEERAKEVLAQASEDGFDRTALKWSMWMSREPSDRIAALIQYLQTTWEMDRVDD